MINIARTGLSIDPDGFQKIVDSKVFYVEKNRTANSFICYSLPEKKILWSIQISEDYTFDFVEDIVFYKDWESCDIQAFSASDGIALSPILNDRNCYANFIYKMDNGYLNREAYFWNLKDEVEERATDYFGETYIAIKYLKDERFAFIRDHAEKSNKIVDLKTKSVIKVLPYQREIKISDDYIYTVGDGWISVYDWNGNLLNKLTAPDNDIRRGFFGVSTENIIPCGGLLNDCQFSPNPEDCFCIDKPENAEVPIVSGTKLIILDNYVNTLRFCDKRYNTLEAMKWPKKTKIEFLEALPETEQFLLSEAPNKKAKGELILICYSGQGSDPSTSAEQEAEEEREPDYVIEAGGGEPLCLYTKQTINNEDEEFCCAFYELGSVLGEIEAYAYGTSPAENEGLECYIGAENDWAAVEYDENKRLNAKSLLRLLRGKGHAAAQVKKEFKKAAKAINKDYDAGRLEIPDGVLADLGTMIDILEEAGRSKVYLSLG